MAELRHSSKGAGAGGASVEINSELLADKLNTFFREWEESKAGLWGGADAVVVVTGNTSCELQYLKSSALQVWLLGYEFPDTLMFFCGNRKVHVVCSRRKARLLVPLRQVVKEKARVEVVVHARGKSSDGGQELDAVLAAVLLESNFGGGSMIGVLSKETTEGDLMERWQKVLQASGSKTVDVSSALSDLLAVKDDVEAGNVKKAAFLCSSVFKKFVLPTIEKVIVREEMITHAELTQKTEEKILDPSRIGLNLKSEDVDIAYHPVFQSGGKFNLRPTAQSDNDLLSYGATSVITCAVGARYAYYCSNLARTYLIDADDSQEQAYRVLLVAQEAAIGALKPGSPLSVAYAAASAVVRRVAPGLTASMSRTAGSSMGIEFRESGGTLDARNANPVQAGMVFNVCLSLENLTGPENSHHKVQDYSMLVADTVIVDAVGGPQVLTNGCSKKYKDVNHSCRQDSEAERKQPRVGTEALKPRAALRSKDQNVIREEPRKLRQKEPALQKNTEMAGSSAAAGRVRGGPRGSHEGAEDFEAYRDVDDIPSTTGLKVQVDQDNEVLLLPISGMLVPFHITTVKSVVNHQDGGHGVLRVIFNVPGAGFPPNHVAAQLFPNSIFVKELSFRSTDNRNSLHVVRTVKALTRQVMQKAERATVVNQEKLTLGTLGRPVSLPDLWIRPPFGGKGRKVPGTLEAHSNGFKYATHRQGESVEIMYRNIKHAFFQSALKEMITLLHFHLHNPIMVGLKKTKDVQFYVEVMGAYESLGHGRRGGRDSDELEEEETDRQKRNRIMKDFEHFVKKVMEVWEASPWRELDLEFDVPYRELGFCGVPYKASGFIVPTVHCLVDLVDTPFLVVSLSEIEIINLERIGLGQNSFDMAIVFKDYRQDVLRIDAIPSTSARSIKQWLNSVNIKYYESRMNLNWRCVLKSILGDKEKFIENGGWEFLNLEGSDSDSEESSESEGYQPSDVDTGSSESSSESDDVSVVESEDEESADDEDDDADEDEGMSWDELEAQATMEDREKGEVSDSDGEMRRRRIKAAGKARAPESPSGGVEPKKTKYRRY